MDEFKKEQQFYCVSGAPGKHPKWGCPCCRTIRTLRLFRKATRKWAKGKLRGKVSKFIRNWEKHY